jgi:hypothetical protein
VTYHSSAEFRSYGYTSYRGIQTLSSPPHTLFHNARWVGFVSLALGPDIIARFSHAPAPPPSCFLICRRLTSWSCSGWERWGLPADYRNSVPAPLFRLVPYHLYDSRLSHDNFSRHFIFISPPGRLFNLGGPARLCFSSTVRRRRHTTLQYNEIVTCNRGALGVCRRIVRISIAQFRRYRRRWREEDDFIDSYGRDDGRDDHVRR